MNFNKIIEDIKKTKKAKPLWTSFNSKLELVSLSVNSDDVRLPSNIIFEAEFTSVLNPKEKLLDFYEALEWLRIQKDVFDITPSIIGKIDKCIGKEAYVNEWQYLECTVTFNN